MPQNHNVSLRDKNSNRIPNRLVKDKIAETVKSIRNLYDVKKRKTRSRPGSLL